MQAEALAERWRARSEPVREHFESLEPVLALRSVSRTHARMAVLHVMRFVMMDDDRVLAKTALWRVIVICDNF